MEDIIMATSKHLTDSERFQIEQLLRQRVPLKEIAKIVGKSPSTISREVRKRRVWSDKYAPYRIHNRCAKRADCRKQYLCEDKSSCTRLCRACNSCNKVCPDFEEEICRRLSDSPYVCNGCPDEHQCPLRKRYYLHKQAHAAYRQTLVESRTGVNITEDELLALDELVSPLVKRGQSIHHIVVSNPDLFEVSEKSIYRYVDGGLLKARNIDMPRICRLKPRRTKPVEHKIDSGCRIGRSYDDFKRFIDGNDISYVEMDSVIGRLGGKCLLTLMFKSCDLMLAFIRDHNTAHSVIDRFNALYECLGAETFSKLFPLLLGDNGSEFSDPKAIEFDALGIQRTKVFYCDPYSSFQKPNVEVNHEFIRKILPKGTSFDNLTQDDINLMMSHINSYSRGKLVDNSPFDVFDSLYGFGILSKLGLHKIPPNQILLKPSLLRK
jgi:IS30 family transposase